MKKNTNNWAEQKEELTKEGLKGPINKHTNMFFGLLAYMDKYHQSLIGMRAPNVSKYKKVFKDCEKSLRQIYKNVDGELQYRTTEIKPTLWD